jgi:hypothetical protein
VSKSKQRRMSAEERQAAYLEERRRRQIVGIIRSGAFLAVIVVLGVVLAMRSRPPQVVSVTLATALDDAYRPIETTTVYAPNDTFYASVQLRGYRQGMDLKARWRYDGTLIKETPLQTDTAGDGYAGFVLRNDAPPWPDGPYSVEIVYDGQVVGSAAFRVEG